MKTDNALCLALLLAAALSSALTAQTPPEPGHSRPMDHRFDPGQYSASFDDPARDAWQKPGEVLKILNLKSGQVAADIGAGTGYFTIRMAKLSTAPKVYAVDIEDSMLDHIRKRAEAEGLKNIHTVRGSGSSANLPEPVDCVLIVNTYHHIADRVGYFGQLRKSLKPGAQVAIVDFRKGGSMGPANEHRFTVEEITAELQKAGFERSAQHTFLPNQEFLVFRMAPSQR